MGTYRRTRNVVADHPAQVLLWDHEANVGADPTMRGSRSSHSVNWRCPVAEDHRWSAPPAAIMRSLEGGFTGCPFCAGRRLSATNSFAARFPAGVGLWHPTRNGDVRPDGILAGSSLRVWWQCPVAQDHEWQAAPIVIRSSIARGNTGCPFCAGFRPSVTNTVAAYSELAAEWHPTRNGDLTPEMAVASTPRKYWWRCRANPDHEWDASGSNRVRGRRCPLCNKSLRSVLEVCLAFELMEFFPDLDLTDDKVRLDGVVTQVDLLIRGANLVIEVDGRFHHTEARSLTRDRAKSALLAAAGYRLIRVREAPLEQITDADVVVPTDSTVKETANAVLGRLRELSWAPLPGLERYLAEPEPRHVAEGLAYVQRERPGKRVRLPGPVVMPREKRWERGLRLVEQFAAREGHPRVPDGHLEDSVDLGTWVGMQRGRYERGKLERDRIARLEAIPGWVWSAVGDQWEDGFSHLVAFQGREGHLDIPAHYWEADGFALGSWVRSHRRRGGRRTMTAEQQKRLEAIPGWTYTTPSESTWERGMAAMEAFARRERHFRVPSQHREGGVDLTSFCARQRGLYHRGRLPAERIARLESTPGWSWRPLDDAWERGFEALESITRAKGSAAVRGDAKWDGYPVGAWVSEQRNRRADLATALRDRLEVLPGWSWSVRSDSWDRHLEALRVFTQRAGHAAVPTGHIELGLPLGSWVIRNRAEYRQGILSDSLTVQLESFPGWLWDPLATRWEAHYAALVAYVDRNGHSRVPANEESDGLPLGQWVVTQRHNHKKGEFDPVRAERLASLPGWAWDAREAAWDDGYSALIEYRQRTGNCDVPPTWTEDGFRLGQWLGTQRSWKRSGRLRPDREKRLAEVLGQAVGFDGAGPA